MSATVVFTLISSIWNKDATSSTTGSEMELTTQFLADVYKPPELKIQLHNKISTVEVHFCKTLVNFFF